MGAALQLPWTACLVHASELVLMPFSLGLSSVSFLVKWAWNLWWDGLGHLAQSLGGCN